MNTTRIVYQQKPDCGQRFAGMTIDQIAKAMWAEWKKQGKTIGTDHYDRSVLVDFASDSSEQDDVSDYHGILMTSPFDSIILTTGGYGGYDFGARELVAVMDEMHDLDQFREMGFSCREEYGLKKALDELIWKEWKDGDGLLWCEVKHCIETYLESLPEEKIEVINNV